MASDGPAHFLSLKVMRVSRPELASAWQPFYSSSPSFSAHSSAHILSLQGSAPLPGHPKTLRDLTHASELLTLPSAFGSIQLGETFSSCLCVNNEAQVDIEVVQVKVEMQTVTAKVTLSELDGDGSGASGKGGQVLGAGDVLENVVHHEVKELGQHVLACAVTYRLPPNARPIPGAAEDTNDPSLVTFRKFYKFAVTNPLSVKTKVHAPRSPTALLSLDQRDKVFLEVHIQNLTQEPMHFERMRLEPIEGWDVQDANHKGDTDNTSIFSGALAIMQPQDTRQYLYILTPKTAAPVPPTLTPGSIIPLGRLDIAWRSPFGEPGRLLTSMLTRRIPLPVTPAPASAVPPHLKRTVTGSMSRPQSPSIPSTRPTSPPPNQRPGSPFRPRAGSVASQIGSARPQSPQPPPLSTAPSTAQQSDLDVNLVVKHFPDDHVKVETPFKVSLQLIVSSSIPLRDFAMRKLAFVVQHLQVPKASQTAPLSHVLPPIEALSPRISSSGFSTPSSASPSSFNYALAHQKILDAAVQRSSSPEGTIHGVNLSDTPEPNVPILPPPFFDGPSDSDHRAQLDPSIMFLGSSALLLPPVQISTGDFGIPSNPIIQDFELTFVAMTPGFHRIGGLRVLLVQDKGTSDFQEFEVEHATQSKVQTLKEYDIIAETWVST